MNFYFYFYFFIISIIVLICILILLRIKLKKALKDLEQKNLELISSRNFISQRNEYLKSLSNKIKTLDMFYISRANLDGLSYICKKCDNKNRKARR